MSIKLDDYRDWLQQTDPHIRDTLDASFAEAARVMSPAGLTYYMDGARALCELGRGSDLVVSYLQEMPMVVKEVGEDVIKDCSTAALKLSSLVSGEIISLLFANLPSAARRLGDAELLRGYLNLIHQLASKAPRGLRPMLSRLDDLFAKLTLGGMRRWALWGAQVHARNFNALSAYFGLESTDSQAMLQQERRGTLLVDHQRKLNFYLRALWGRDFFLRPTSGDFENREGYRPYIESQIIHIPDAFDNIGNIPGKELYRATVAHAAAHLMYTRSALSAETLNPLQMFIIGVFEDARVEQLAIREFPGLKKLWSQFYEELSASNHDEKPVVKVLHQLSHTLLSETAGETEIGLQDIITAFHDNFNRDAQNINLSLKLGIMCYNRIKENMPLPALRELESSMTPYRDDNRYLWAFEEQALRENEYVPASQRQVRRNVSLMEMINELDCELAGDDAQEVWNLESEFFRDGDPENVSINQLEGKEPVSLPFHYPEWDYQVQLHRPDWVTVLEKQQPKKSPELIDRILVEYKPLANRIKRIIDGLQPRGLIRERRREDGDEIDLNAAINAMVTLRMNEMPDTRINIRHTRKTRDLAVLVLLDLSESTNEVLSGTDRPVLQLAREATALLAWAIDKIGDPFALHGFASDGRHDVQYYRFKDFEQPYNDSVKAKLAGMEGGLSTRMGAALRHAGNYLSQHPQQKKLILLISDGEPADIDERDPQYLRNDTKKAVDELSGRGILTYCLTLDPDADDYVARIFGANSYTVVDNVQRLPERLPALFMSLTK
jgi:nitric oxide reductase NorD protein